MFGTCELEESQPCSALVTEKPGDDRAWCRWMRNGSSLQSSGSFGKGRENPKVFSLPRTVNDMATWRHWFGMWVISTCSKGYVLDTDLLQLVKE